MTVTEEDFAKLLAELSHLRRQRDELQAHNTRLEERARVAETKLRQHVDHPAHYQHPSGVECIDIVRHMSLNLGNAVKYLWRAGKKGCAATDLRKAAWYLRDGELGGTSKLDTKKVMAVVACEGTHPALRDLLVEVVVLASGERLSSTIDKQAMCSALEAEADAIEASP